jgi:hypothetical protein
VKKLISQMVRSIFRNLPKAIQLWLAKELLIASEEPYIANVDIREFNGIGIQNKSINLINCVQTSPSIDGFSDGTSERCRTYEASAKHTKFQLVVG